MSDETDGVHESLVPEPTAHGDDHSAMSLPQQDFVTLQGVFEQAPDAIIMVDNHGRIAMVNTQSDVLFGYARAALIGQPIEILVPQAVQARHTAYRAAYSAAPHTRPMGAGLHLLARRADGSEFPAEISLSPVRTAQSMLVMAIIRDVSERAAANRRLTAEVAEHQRLEAALREAMAAAEQASQAKSEFLSRMSHELRTPLNAILGFAQVLQMDSLSVDQRASIEHILNGGRHLLRLINEVLDLARVEAGHLALSLEPVLVRFALLDAVATIRPLADVRKITIRADLAALDDHAIVADRLRLTQVLLNLLSNAVKYNRDHGQIHLQGSKEGEQLVFQITDTGIGIPAGRMRELFVPFERLGQDQTAIEGSGLGLALSKRLVEAMGGTLTATSITGQGSTFTLTFPATAEHDSPTNLTTNQPPERPLIRQHAMVLLIEDNLANLRLIERLLEPATGITLLAAMQGQLGLDLAREHQPALILLDLHLPDLPGEDVLQRLLADPATRAIPVVMVTADATARQAERLLANGARAYLTKPIDVPAFLKTIKALLNP